MKIHAIGIDLWNICFHRRLAAIYLVASLAMLWMVSVPAHAQVAGATLSGNATDATGAVILDANISIKNVANGVMREIAVNSAGFYTARPGSNWEKVVMERWQSGRTREDDYRRRPATQAVSQPDAPDGWSAARCRSDQGLGGLYMVHQPRCNRELRDRFGLAGNPDPRKRSGRRPFCDGRSEYRLCS